MKVRIWREREGRRGRSLMAVTMSCGVVEGSLITVAHVQSSSRNGGGLSATGCTGRIRGLLFDPSGCADRGDDAGEVDEESCDGGIGGSDGGGVSSSTGQGGATKRASSSRDRKLR